MSEKVENPDKYFWQNALGASFSEFLWGLGLPVVLESTFVTVFLSYSGVSNSEIGLVGMILSISFAIAPFFSAYFTSRMPYKKAPTIWLQVFPSISIMLLGLCYIFFGKHNSVYPVFILFYSLFSIGLASTVPVWQNYIVKIFTPKNCVRGISIIMIGQNIGKLLGGTILAIFLASVKMSIYNAGIIFLLSGTAFLVGSLCFIITRENKDMVDSSITESAVGYFLHYIKHILNNRGILLYLLQDIEFNVVVVTITFYARYAVDWCSVPISEAAGAFIILLFVGAVSANLILGFMKKFNLKVRYAFIKISSVIALLLVLFLKEIFAFYVISFLLGFSRSGRVHLYGPLVKGLSGLDDASPYYAITPFLMLPVSAGLPVGAGFLLDMLSGKKAGAYSVLFAVLLMAVILTFVPFLKLKFPVEHGKEIPKAEIL